MKIMAVSLVTLKRYDEAMKQFSAAAKLIPPAATTAFFNGTILVADKDSDTEGVKELRDSH